MLTLCWDGPAKKTRRAWATAHNNPLNTTLQTSGSTGNFNSDGVQSYATEAGGISATAQTLLGGYPTIVADLRSGGGIGANAGSELFKWSGSNFATGSYTSV
jgi:hypothetical protein